MVAMSASVKTRGRLDSDRPRRPGEGTRGDDSRRRRTNDGHARRRSSTRARPHGPGAPGPAGAENDGRSPLIRKSHVRVCVARRQICGEVLRVGRDNAIGGRPGFN